MYCFNLQSMKRMATNGHLITHDPREEGIVSAASLRLSVCVCQFVYPRKNRELAY